METPWYAAFPTAKTTAPSVSRSEVLGWLQDDTRGTVDFVLVDLRRTDYEGGTILGSINLPAQSLYPTIPTLYTIFKQAGVAKVVWYCGSSGGRGNRAAAWFADYLKEHDSTGMQSLVLEGGIKGWVKAGEEYVTEMQGYDAASWKELGN